MMFAYIIILTVKKYEYRDYVINHKQKAGTTDVKKILFSFLYNFNMFFN
jgi:hypothetical protein